MKTHTSNFKNEIATFGRELDSVITYEFDGETIKLGNEQLNSVSPHYEGAILKSVMKQLDIESTVEIPLETQINYKLGVKVRDDEVQDYRDNYDYINYGNYIVYKSEKQEDTGSYKITCYDKMLYSMVKYEDMQITYPITIRGYINAICNYLGLIFKNASDTFANYNKEIQSELFLDSEGGDLNYTFRDVLDQLAEVTASTICLDENDQLEIRYINEGEFIPYEILGETTQNGTPTPTNPVPINNKTGEITHNNKKINLGNIKLCKIEDYQDRIYKDNGKWYIEKQIGKVVLDGSENWQLSSGWTKPNTNVFYATIKNDVYYPSFSSLYWLNDYFKSSSRNDLRNIDENQLGFSGAATITNPSFTIRIDKNLGDNVENFKTWLSDNNVTVYYVLSTPVIEEITDSTLINQLENAGTITDTINEEYLKNINVNFAEKYGPINSIVLSRSAESDNVYLRDEESVSQDGLCELKIIDNQIMNWNDRSDYLQDILDQLDGLEYYLNDFSSTGVCYYDLCDRYNIQISEETYSCVMLNDEVNITTGMEENIYTDMPTETQTDYTKADKTDRRINQTYIIVDKQEGEIQELASKIVDVSEEKTGIGIVILENAHKGILHKLSIVGNMSLLYPKNNLYPKNTLYPISTFLLKIDNTYYNLDINYLNYMSSTIYDEFIYKDGKCNIIRRVGINNGEMYALQDEIIEPREDIILNVDTNSNISSVIFPNTILNVEYLLENEYTDVFASQVEVKSEIKTTADGINLEVSKKVNENEIISKINQTPEQISIEASKINLNGIVTANENFKILEDGSMVANNGEFNGVINANSGTFKGVINGGAIQITGNYSEQYPYIYVESSNSTSVNPILTSIWTNGISCMDYGNGTPVIRTEQVDGYAELSGRVVNAFGFNNVSLAEKKKNFEKFENAIDIIKKTDIYKFHYKGDNDKDKKHIGLIIGKDYNYSKELTNKENNSVDLYSMIGVCFKAIQEQQKQIEKLQQELQKLKEEK